MSWKLSLVLGGIRAYLGSPQSQRELSVTRVTPLFMGTESCEKSESLQTFFATFLMYALLWEQKVAEKVWKLSLSTIIARSGAKVCKLFAL